METLLDRHLATFDRWLHAYLTSSTDFSRSHYYLTAVTLLDQLNPKQFHWDQVSVILQHQLPFIHHKLFDLLDWRGLNMEFTQIVSKFLMDRDRAGSFSLDSYNYADLAAYILKILGDK